jgi:hypothetical protein
MSLPAAIECGEALVVFEGARRRRGSFAGDAPLWPDAREGEDVRRRLAQRRPLLVVLGGPHARAALLTEQFAQAPPALAAAAHETVVELAGVPVPALDWLPAELRERGLAFLRAGADGVSGIPRAQCPPFSLETPDPVVPHLRFLHRLRPCLETPPELAGLVSRAFRPTAIAEQR